MDQNPSYSLNQQLYEEVGQPNNVGSRVAGDRRSYNTHREVCDYEEPISSTTFKKQQEPETKKCFVGVLAAVFVSVSIIFLIAVIVLGITSHLQIGNLQSELQQLKNQLNWTTTEHGTLAQTSNLQPFTQNSSAMAQLNSLQSSVDTLTTRVNTPVNLYQNCIEESRTCKVNTPSNAAYRRYCYTAPISITKNVSTITSRSH